MTYDNLRCVQVTTADSKPIKRMKLWRRRSTRNYRVFNLKVERQLSREYFTSDAIYNGSAGMILYCYMCRSWQDCCRRGENRSWPSVSVESVDSEWTESLYKTYKFCL